MTDRTAAPVDGAHEQAVLAAEPKQVFEADPAENSKQNLQRRVALLPAFPSDKQNKSPG